MSICANLARKPSLGVLLKVLYRVCHQVSTLVHMAVVAHPVCGGVHLSKSPHKLDIGSSNTTGGKIVEQKCGYCRHVSWECPHQGSSGGFRLPITGAPLSPGSQPYGPNDPDEGLIMVHVPY